MNLTFGIGPADHGREEIRLGAYAHWKGETVPVRGPNRELLGHAKVADVFVDGNVLYVTIQTNLNLTYPGLRSIVEIVAGTRNGMSFQPMRDDPVAQWLKRKRDIPEMFGNSDFYWAIDGLLDEYRARADYGLTLDADLSELPEGY